jgi:hypothetical protein
MQQQQQEQQRRLRGSREPLGVLAEGAGWQVAHCGGGVCVCGRKEGAKKRQRGFLQASQATNLTAHAAEGLNSQSELDCARSF